MRRVPCFRPISEYRLLRLALLVEQDVRWLDLAMDDAVLMDVLQRVGDRGRQRCGLAERRLLYREQSERVTPSTKSEPRKGMPPCSPTSSTGTIELGAVGLVHRAELSRADHPDQLVWTQGAGPLAGGPGHGRAHVQPERRAARGAEGLVGEVEGDHLDRVMAMRREELHEPSLHSAKRGTATLIMSCWTGSTNQGESRENSEASLSCLQSPVRKWAHPCQRAKERPAWRARQHAAPVSYLNRAHRKTSLDRTLARGLPMYPRIRPASPPLAIPSDLERSSRLHLFAIDFTSQRKSLRDFFINP